tara:strand:+ start:102 stop:593 length:492 start_codon:yes stop_codon:yes gene_type:complete
VVEFKIPIDQRPQMAAQTYERVTKILKQENVPFDDKVIAKLIMKHFPDIRRILNELQRYSVSGNIDVGILSELGDISIKQLVSSMKSKEFGKVRSWVVEHLDNDQTQVFRKIYDGLYTHMKDHSIPEAVLILAEYQYKSAFVADHEINMVACLTELMMRCEFK